MSDTDTLAQLREEVAETKGLTTAQASRLVGATREELEADADDLLATFGVQADEDLDPAKLAARIRRRPWATADPGSSSEDPAALAARVPRRY
jgi:cell division septum initiation protein DivIVA